MRHLLLPILAVSLFSGCTSSGGGGGGNGGPVAGEIGRRAVPGFEVVVSKEAGAPADVYRIDLIGDTPQSVAAWTGDGEYDPAAPTITADAIVGSTNAWRVTLPAGDQVWVRITDANGNVMEVGGEDFPLSH